MVPNKARDSQHVSKLATEPAVYPVTGQQFHRFPIGRHEVAEEGSSPSPPWTNQ